MVKIIPINTIEELLPLFAEQPFQQDIGRNRSTYIYRGMRKSEYHLTTSIQRNCKDHWPELEVSLITNFSKYGALEDPSINTSVWHQMVLGQHHQLPTRLLDWSHSFLIALNFATTESSLQKMDQNDCAVWRIDMEELSSLLPNNYQDILVKYRTSIFNLTMLNEVAPTTQQYDRDMGNSSMVIFEPPSIDPRIVNQYSFFSILPSSMKDMEEFLNKNTNNSVKYVINKKLRWRIRDMLDALNMCERTTHPGLDGVSLWLARHYYVK